MSEVIAAGLRYDDSRAKSYSAGINPINGKSAEQINRDQGLAGFTTADLYAGYRPPGYFIKGIINPGDVIVPFGESGSLKTFAVLDMTMHLATGSSYGGNRVRQTGVLFIAGEGGEGIKRRIMAWLIRHGIDAASKQPPIFVATEAANLMFEGATIRLTIKNAEQRIGSEIGVVVFDTLSANLGPGDESKAEDIGQALRHARTACGSRAIILVHHVGHGPKDRERGSYALRAAADCRILVERPGNGSLVTVSCLKAKDGEPFKPMTFETRVVELPWLDVDGDELTSLILEPTEKEIPRDPTGKAQKAILHVLTKGGTSMKRQSIVAELEPFDIRRTSVYRAINEMLKAGQLVEGFDKISLPEASE